MNVSKPKGLFKNACNVRDGMADLSFQFAVLKSNKIVLITAFRVFVEFVNFSTFPENSEFSVLEISFIF